METVAIIVVGLVIDNKQPKTYDVTKKEIRAKKVVMAEPFLQPPVLSLALTGNVLKLLDALVHGSVGFADVVLQLLRVDDGQGLVQPALLPAYPIRGGGPQVAEGLEVAGELLQAVVLDGESTAHIQHKGPVCFRGLGCLLSLKHSEAWSICMEDCSFIFCWNSFGRKH